MITREQDNFITQLSERHDGESLSVRDGFADGHINVTSRHGSGYEVDEDGNYKMVANWSVRNWGQS